MEHLAVSCRDRLQRVPCSAIVLESAHMHMTFRKRMQESNNKTQNQEMRQRCHYAGIDTEAMKCAGCRDQSSS